MLSVVRRMTQNVLVFAVAAFFTCRSLLAQESITQDKQPALRHFKLEVGENGLHCPFLGMTVKDKIRQTEGFTKFFVDKQDRYLTFACPASRSITEADVVKIATDAGYPKDIIRVTISDKPFESIKSE